VTNPISWDYLTAPLSETPTWGPFSIFYVALFVMSFTVAAYMYLDAPTRFATNKPVRDAIRVGTQWMMWLTAIGLIFFLVRALRFELITMQMRIWLYICFALYLAMIGYFIYYIRVVLPPKLAALERHRQRRAYMNQPSHRGKSRARREAAARRRATR
jgi:hypothetical protein